MAPRPPTEDDIRDLGDQLHLDLSPEEVADFTELVTDGLASYETVRELGRVSRPTTPRERDPALVRRDVGRGYISPEAARRDYGFDE